jgi:Raf kinase inhibitor-like YbhB/YbcL family protein
MQLSSPAFQSGEVIPSRFTCDGADVSPALVLADLPQGTACLALIVDDPDAPGSTWDHWVAYDIPLTTAIPEGVKALGTSGRNSWRKPGYGGPCPPFGEHRYFFRVYALDRPLGLAPGASKKQVLEAMKGRILAEATLLGRYTRR